MGEVRSINAVRANKANDNSLLSPLEALEDAAADIRAGVTKCDKLLVLMLDTGGAGAGDYEVHFVASHLSSSEAVALLETAKQLFLKPLTGG